MIGPTKADRIGVLSSRGYAQHAVAALLLCLLIGAVLAHRLHGERPSLHGLESSDLTHYFLPNAAFLHEELARGNLPIWNPYQLAGQPYLALHVPAVLYPPNLALAALLAPERALEAHFALHMLLAGFFTWLFAGRLGLGTPARFAAAVLYVLSGPMLLGLYQVAYLAGQTWLPAILWAAHGLLEEARGRWALALAAFFALSFLSGFAQGFVFEAQVALAYGLFGLRAIARRGTRLRIVGLAALGALVAVGLVAPQLLPALEFTHDSVRDLEGLPLHEAAILSLSPGDLWRGLLGLPGVGPGPHVWPSETLGPMRWFGTLPIAIGAPLIAIGLRVRETRAHWLFFAALAAFAAFYQLGLETPVFELYHALPLGDLFRVPRRLAFVFAFAVGLMVAIGIQGVASWVRARSGERPRAPAIAAGLLLVLVGADSYRHTRLVQAHPVLAPSSPGARGAPAALVELLRSNVDRARAFVQFTGPHRLGSLDFEPPLSILYKFGMMNRVFGAPEYEGAMPGAYLRYFDESAHPPWHGRLSVLPELSGPDPAHRGPGRRSRSGSELVRFLDLMAVRTYVVPRPAPVQQARRLAAMVGSEPERLPGLLRMERLQALPRAYTVERVIYEPDLDSALARISESRFQPRTEAILIGDAEPPQERSATHAGDAAVPAAITAYDSEEVNVSARCEVRCLLVLTDLHHFGWEASVDGTSAPILLANALYRGVWLEPGLHIVQFSYRPLSFRVGVALFFTTVVATALGAGVLAWRQRVQGA